MTLTEPFDVLLRANNVVLTNLRRDEATPELQKQLTQTGMPSSAQAYFCDPYSNSYLGPQVFMATRKSLQSAVHIIFEIDDGLSQPASALLFQGSLCSVHWLSSQLNVGVGLVRGETTGEGAVG